MSDEHDGIRHVHFRCRVGVPWDPLQDEIVHLDREWGGSG